MYWILCVAVLAGATSASPKYVSKEIQPRNINVLQSFPSVVQIEFYFFWSTIDWSKECTGSILTSRFVVTAASCFTGWSYESRFRRVRAGSSQRGTGGSVVYIQDRLNHPSFTDTNYSGDVSVVRTMSPFVYSSLVGFATVAAPGSFIPNNLRLSQPGWGRARQPAISNQEVITAERGHCVRRDGSSSAALNATENMLCVVPQSGIVSNDDVGGPWIFTGLTVGVVGGVNALGTYRGLMAADVAQYTQWIIDTVNNW